MVVDPGSKRSHKSRSQSWSVPPKKTLPPSKQQDRVLKKIIAKSEVLRAGQKERVSTGRFSDHLLKYFRDPLISTASLLYSKVRELVAGSFQDK
jgi:hypothetical protein